MNFLSIGLLALVGAGLFLAIRQMARGRASCCGRCAGCAHARQCAGERAQKK